MSDLMLNKVLSKSPGKSLWWKGQALCGRHTKATSSWGSVWHFLLDKLYKTKVP